MNSLLGIADSGSSAELQCRFFNVFCGIRLETYEDYVRRVRPDYCEETINDSDEENVGVFNASTFRNESKKGNQTT